MIKQIVDEMWQGAFHAALRSELLAQKTLFASDDHHEAVEARAAKRRPNNTGR